VLLIASALIRRGTDVLLVRQQRANRQDYWSLPGGVVDPGELLPEAMAREVREKSGLEVLDPGHLLYVVQHDKPTHVGYMMEFCFAVSAWRGVVATRDLDEILEARFMPPTDAIAKLRDAGGPDWYEPVAAYLQGKATAGTLWL
jgi:8-oxo-dGTP diphosphatase